MNAPGKLAGRVRLLELPGIEPGRRGVGIQPGNHCHSPVVKRLLTGGRSRPSSLATSLGQGNVRPPTQVALADQIAEPILVESLRETCRRSEGDEDARG